MPIYNMNGGGSNLTYTVKFSPLRPDQSINPKTGEIVVNDSFSSVKNILWIKDSFEFLNPYENEFYANCELKDVIAYKNAMPEGTATKPAVANQIGAMFTDDLFNVLHLDATQYRQNSVVAIDITAKRSAPYIAITIPAKAGNTTGDTTLHFAFSTTAENDITEGSVIEEVFSTTFTYNAKAVQTINLEKDKFVDLGNNLSNRIADVDGKYGYKTLLIFYDKSTTGTCGKITVNGYKDSNYTSTKTNYLTPAAAYHYDYGFFVKNQIIADITNTYKTSYFITEKNKSYRVYSNPNNTAYLFTVTRNTTASAPPTEGDSGRLIDLEKDTGVYFQPNGEKYYLISGNDFNNICFTYPIDTEDIPYILEGTLTYDLHHLGVTNKSKISDEYQYMGYEINSFEPKDLINNSTSSLKLWIIDGNNLESNIMITKPKKKKQFLSLEGVVTRIPYQSDMLKPKQESNPENISLLDDGDIKKHNELYFLHSELYIAELNKWIELKTRSNQFFNLKTLLEGTLTNIYYEENTSLRDYAFYHYDELQSCHFPNCSTIGSSAFYQCNRLLNVNFPVWYEDSISPIWFDSKNTKDTSPFAGCTNITSATFGFGGIADGTITENTKSANRKITKTGFPLFSASANLTTLSLPKCTVIGSGALAFYYNLKEVTLNELTTDINALTKTVVNIKNQAFHTCVNLTEIKNSHKIQNIGNSAFYSNEKLHFINLPNVITIGANAFMNCTTLSRIAFVDTPNSQLTSIGQSAFQNTAIREINAPNCNIFGLMKTSNNCFSGYNITSSPIVNCGPTLSIITLGISNGTTSFPAILAGSLSKSTSNHFNNLVSISLSKITSIANTAFRNLQNLEYITLSPSLSVIPQEAFTNCGKIIEEVAPREEYGFETREFAYENLTYGYSNSEYTYMPGRPQYILDEDSSTYISRIDDSGNNVYENFGPNEDKTVYEPLLDDDGNLQFEEAGTYTYTPPESTESVTKSYYLIIYDITKPVKNYDKIIYAIRNPDTNEEEDETEGTESTDRFVIEEDYRVLYGHNERLMLADESFYVPDEHDDWIYKYKMQYDEQDKPIAPNATTNYIFNECYYKHKTNEKGEKEFKQIQATSGEYSLAQNSSGNVTVYYNRRNSNSIHKIIDGGIEKLNKITYNDFPLYRFKNNNAPLFGRLATIEQHDTNSSIIISRVDEFGEKIQITYPITPDSEYYYKFERTGNFEQKLLDDGYVWDFPVFNYSSPIYKTSYENISRRLINKYSEPIILKATYEDEAALSRIVDENTNKPVVDENFQLKLNKVISYKGLEFVNKVALNANGELTVYPGGNVLGVRAIGKLAFSNCYNLKEIYLNCYPPIPDSSTIGETLSIPYSSSTYTIGDFAFQNCSTLLVVNMPYCVNFATPTGSKITGWVFSKCTQLASINLSNLSFSTNANGNYIYNQFVSYNTKTKVYDCYHPMLENIKFNAILGISNNAFQNITTLSHAMFNKCTNISAAAFKNTGIGFITQSYLMNVVEAKDEYGNGYYDTWELNEDFNNFITVGREYTGYQAIELGNPYLNDVVYYIEKEPGVYEIASGYQENTIYYLLGENEGEYTNANIAPNLNNIYKPNTYYEKIDEENYQLVSDDAFDPSKTYYEFTNILRNMNYFSRILQIPSVTTLGDEVFYGCHNLVGGILDKITKIPTRAFFDCVNLTNITQNTFEEDLPDFEGDILQPYDYLRIPKVSQISPNAFSACGNVKKVIFNHNITSIGAQAFHNCNNITEIRFTPTYKVTSTTDENGNPIEEITPQTLTIGSGAFSCTKTRPSLRIYFDNFLGADHPLPTLDDGYGGTEEENTKQIFPDDSSVQFIFENEAIADYYKSNIGTWGRYKDLFTDISKLTQ